MNLFRGLKYQGWAIAWTILISILCLIKTPGSASTGFFFTGFDKLVHLGFFYVLTVLLFFGKIRYQHNYSFSIFTIFKIIVITALIGGAIEMLQYLFFDYRSAELWDFYCDMIGVFMGVFSYVLLHVADYNKK
ncbi:VanZ family protein [Pedobacter immunditicola]|uniref:VanZ family protein n=1 Tax=Pedobacter immunditicola TaxID=3133440 RepID=UPI0030B187E6